MNNKLYPTGTCFDDAFEYLELLCKDNDTFLKKMDSYRLVHGICCTFGENFSHAWVEDENFCIEKKILNNKIPVFIEIKKSLFYKEMVVKKVIKYTMKEVAYLNDKFVTFGPWEKELLELCKDYTGDKPCKDTIDNVYNSEYAQEML